MSPLSHTFARTSATSASCFESVVRMKESYWMSREDHRDLYRRTMSSQCSEELQRKFYVYFGW